MNITAHILFGAGSWLFMYWLSKRTAEETGQGKIWPLGLWVIQVYLLNVWAVGFVWLCVGALWMWDSIRDEFSAFYMLAWIGLTVVCMVKGSAAGEHDAKPTGNTFAAYLAEHPDEEIPRPAVFVDEH
jgi:hypothetical protein